MKRSDLTGRRFERLLAIKEAGRNNQNRILWLCRCDCGNEVEVSTGAFGRTQSCGCLASEVTSNRSVIHGQSRAGDHTGSKTYQVWIQMRRRCRERPEYAHVSVCERWETFENFLADMGEVPTGLTIDREDPNGNYEPENCRWATAKEQANNRRNTVHVTIDGVTRTASEWSDLSGVQGQTIKWRLRNGYIGQEIINGKRATK